MLVVCSISLEPFCLDAREQKKMDALRPGGKPSIGKAYLIQGMKQKQMAAEQGTTVDKIKVSGSAQQTVFLCLPCVACPVVAMRSDGIRCDLMKCLEIR